MKLYLYLSGFLLFNFLINCESSSQDESSSSIRNMIDTVGFAHHAEQMDSVMTQITTLFSERLRERKEAIKISESTSWKMAISPHDDYAYASFMYPLVSDNIKAKTIIIFGVAHKAATLGLKDQIIFDSFSVWQGPYGPISVSMLRNELISALPAEYYVVNDSMQAIEHSVEALLPFLQYNNRDIEIISILVPHMNFERMTVISQSLTNALYRATVHRGWNWGTDYALLISTDAVHYGDEGWGGKNFAYYGTDANGYKDAIEHEYEIMYSCLTGALSQEKIKCFCAYTLQPDDYTKYKWTWCGRYSVPFGLLTAYYLQDLADKKLQGVLLDYATSIDHEHLPVKHLNMGTTAPAYKRHWVGYAAIGYK